MKIPPIVRSLAVLAVATVLGCDRPPPPPVVALPANVPDDVITEQGRGGYDWRVDKRNYVLRPDEPDEVDEAPQQRR